MKEKPILFNTEMVKAILEDRKTQTRRVIKQKPTAFYAGHYFDEYGHLVKCPYGQVGDHLWVRETFQYGEFNFSDNLNPIDAWIHYKDGTREFLPIKGRIGSVTEPRKWRPSIFMPRWASRITLEITNIRVQRVQEISWEDAISEGIKTDGEIENTIRGWYIGNQEYYSLSPIITSQKLWNSLYGDKYPWDLNPWVWVLTYKRIEAK
jgi:hypothetical protein